MTRKEQHYKNVQKWPKKQGKADLLRFLKGERLTRAEAIKSRCYECVQGEDTQPCLAVTCPLIGYCQWNQSDDQ